MYDLYIILCSNIPQLVLLEDPQEGRGGGRFEQVNRHISYGKGTRHEPTTQAACWLSQRVHIFLGQRQDRGARVAKW